MPARMMLLCLTLVAVACGDDGDTPTGPSSGVRLGFFVTSATSTSANLGGLKGADALCQRLAESVGTGRRIWRAYLSAEHDPYNGDRPIDARARIGTGPWVNANGITVASNLAELHNRTGNADAFVDERGQRINGQWTGSPAPVQHDILTGSTAEGALMPGFTCADWTSESSTMAAQVGHSDGMGPGGSTAGALASWNSSHANASCANTAPRGGAGRLDRFAQSP